LRDTIKDLGYDDPAKGFDYKTCNVIVAVEEQSADLAQALSGAVAATPSGATTPGASSTSTTMPGDDAGDGDQCVVTGYATDETPSRMPLSHVLAVAVCRQLAQVRRNGVCDWIRPDGKCLVTIEYKQEGNGVVVPVRVHSVVVSAQHAEEASVEQIRADLHCLVSS